MLLIKLLSGSMDDDREDRALDQYFFFSQVTAHCRNFSSLLDLQNLTQYKLGRS